MLCHATRDCHTTQIFSMIISSYLVYSLGVDAYSLSMVHKRVSVI